jgi:glycosyltransferase involved in cell wall biosynthesis
MKIVHVTSYFIKDMAYQENLLPRGQVELGHDVVILTGSINPDFGFNTDSREMPRGTSYEHGVLIERLDQYIELSNRGILYKNLYKSIRKHSPDVLLCHGIGQPLAICLIYKIMNPDVILQMDTHSTSDNSGHSKFAFFYHGFARLLFTMFRDRFHDIFAIAPETSTFMQEWYGLSPSDITLLPLPGDSSLMQNYDELRDSLRLSNSFLPNELVLVHTGKLPGDKETKAVLDSFMLIKDERYRLIIAGSADAEFEAYLNQCIALDKRIEYRGWNSATALRELFISADLLVQPGSLSNTFVDAICSGLPVLLDDTPQGRYLTRSGNGSVIARGSVEKLSERIMKLLEPNCSAEMGSAARAAAHDLHYTENAKLSLRSILK